MTPLIHGGIYVVTCLIGSIFYLILLIKLFKNEGFLKGLLGFFTGIYTYVWGWMKHKELKLTKIMWALTILTVLPMVQLAIFGTDIIASLSMEEERRVETKKMDFKKAKAAKKKKIAMKKKIVKKGPDKNVDWNQKAHILWKDGKYTKPDKALKYLDNFVTLNPKSADAYNNRGVARHNLKKNKDAIKDFDKAVELNPEFAKAYHNRANAYYELNDDDKALADYGRALELDPKYALAYVNRGLLYYQTNEIDKACGDFSKACELGDCDGLTWAEDEKLCR